VSTGITTARTGSEPETGGSTVVAGGGRAPGCWIATALVAVIATALAVIGFVVIGGGNDEGSSTGVDETTTTPTGESPQAGVSSQAPTPTQTPAPTPTPTPTLTPTPPATPTPSATPTPTLAPVPPIITSQLQFTQIINRYTGTCPPNVPPPGTNASSANPSTVVVDWQHHTIKVGDSNVSPFDPGTRAAQVTWPDGRSSNVTIGPTGLSGESGFFPYPTNASYSNCMVIFTTSAVVVDGQSLVP
jgi:hypothetical protein